MLNLLKLKAESSKKRPFWNEQTEIMTTKSPISIEIFHDTETNFGALYFLWMEDESQILSTFCLHLDRSIAMNAEYRLCKQKAYRTQNIFCTFEICGFRTNIVGK